LHATPGELMMPSALPGLRYGGMAKLVEMIAGSSCGLVQRIAVVGSTSSSA
jgi:hypothetical protein